MPQVEVNNITIEYDIRGEGEPILFVMGLGGQLTDWRDEFIDLFVARGFQAIRFDNRDIGLSTKATWTPPSQAKTIAAMAAGRPLKGVGYTVTDMASDAAGLLGALGIDRAHVVGMSMGGMIAQELAIGHPARVISLCSIMSNPGDRRSGGIAASLMAKLARLKPPTLDTAVQRNLDIFTWISGPHFDPVDYRRHAEQMLARSFSPAGTDRQAAAIAGSRDRTPHLRSLDVPTLVIHGLVDPLVKPSGGIATAKAIPGSRLLALPDMGHDLPEARWLEMCDAIVHNFRRADLPLMT